MCAALAYAPVVRSESGGKLAGFIGGKFVDQETFQILPWNLMGCEEALRYFAVAG